HKYI
ncbi:hypothetical protein D046_0254B, partial [Vibrio parahaemolyticus V-223/04]